MRLRSVTINLKVLPEHKKALRAIAQSEGEAMSVVLRRLIKRAAYEYGVWPYVEEPNSDTHTDLPNFRGTYEDESKSRQIEPS